MVQFIINVLGPTFYGMGVSAADFEFYVKALSGHIYVILFAFIAMVTVMIAAVKVKKGFRAFVRWQSFLCFLLVSAIVINLAAYGPLKTNLSGILNSANVSVSEETRKESRGIVERVGEEGIVLLKNDGLLPIEEEGKALNVFGWASTSPIYGGSGSGASDTSANTGILDALSAEGYSINEQLRDMYIAYQNGRESLGLNFREQIWDLPEPTASYYTQEVMDNAKAFSDTAVVVIGRSGGEGADLPTDMHAIIEGTYDIAEEVSLRPDRYGYFGGRYKNNGTEPDFEPGESYLELSRPEEELIKLVCDSFDKVIIIINANNPMELGWVDEYEEIGGVLFVPGAGATGFAGLGRIIKGSVNPSGKTADTFVKDLFKTPYIHHIGHHGYSNVEDLKATIVASDEAAEGVVSFLNYVEGIYVGYKFYETAAEEGLINYEEHVQYPFGYGLSYTDFRQEIQNFKDAGESITFSVSVTNVGNRAGKEVVEIYFTPPYTNGGIEKSSINLLDFEKTKLLEPGESQAVDFVIPKEEMASYDSAQVKVDGGGYILEAGEYLISLRSDSHSVLDEAKFNVSQDIDYGKTKRASDATTAVNQFESYARGDFTELSRKDAFANYEEACGPMAASAYVMSEKVRKEVEREAFAFYNPADYNNPADVMPVMGANNGLKLHALAGADYTDPRWETLLDQMSFEDMVNLINVGGWQTAEIKSIGKVATADCDGPAGLNNFITQVYGTSYPAEHLMAQTWNKSLLYEVGLGITNEFVDVGYYGWYGPGANTHRSAFAGRNFEYFSEDGVLAGKLAAAEINGGAQNKVYAYMKHFALNDQETNRCAFLLTFASEQAIREIYLRPFEIAVKNYEGKAGAMMSSFNFIGTVSGSSNGDLLVDVLRKEWGFEGMVITDYDGSYGYMISDKSVRNGNDLMLGFGKLPSDEFKDRSASAVIAMRNACKNILYTIANSGHYAGGDPSSRMDNMTKTFLLYNLLFAAAFILAQFLLIRGYKKRKGAGTVSAEISPPEDDEQRVKEDKSASDKE